MIHYDTVQYKPQFFIALKYHGLKMATEMLNQQVLHFKQRPFPGHITVSLPPLLQNQAIPQTARACQGPWCKEITFILQSW